MILSLSRRVQKQAQKMVIRLSFTNALGFGFITGQVIFLIGLMYGANDTQMGLLFAAPFITALAVLLAPLLLNGRETTTIWSRFWLARTGVALCYFAVLWVHSHSLRVWLLVLIYYSFATLRALGMSGYFTVMRALAQPRENPALMAKVHLSTKVAVLLTQCIAFVILTYNLLGTEERNLFFLVAIGLFFNILTAVLIGRLPRTGYLQDSSIRNLFKATRHILSFPVYREVAIMTAFHAAMVVFVGYVISYMRNVAHFRSADIFLFTVVGFGGAIIISNFLRIIGSHIRPRILLFASHGALAVLSLIWACIRFTPAMEEAQIPIMILYGLTITCQTVSTTVSLQLRTGRLPTQQPVDYSINYDMAQVIGAVVAIVCARFSAAPALQTAQYVHPYTYTFLIWAVASVIVCVLALRMHTQPSRGFREDMLSLLPSNLFTIIRAHRLDKNENMVRKHLALEGLLQAPTHVSRELILEHMRSPDIGARRSCIRVLMGYPVDDAVPLLLAEAASPVSPLRCDAVTALGFSGHPELIPSLRALWDDAPYDVRATLIKTLLRLGGEVDDDDIYAVWEQCPRNRKGDILIGLALTSRCTLLFSLLGKALAERPDHFWSRSLFGYTASAAGERASMFDVFLEEDNHPGNGITYIRANYEGEWPDGVSAKSCEDLIYQEKYTEMMYILRTIYDEEWVTIYDRSTALGVLFLLLLRHDGRFVE